MECETCGGNDFYKESGFFYCNDCQTQSQDIREHAFEDDTVNAKFKSSRKIQKSKTKKENKLISWECYNIILHGLTQELIDLGASRSLKKVIKCLWFNYLEKLELINVEDDVQPKFPLVNLKHDVEILYDHEKKKRKRTKSISDESELLDASSGSFRRDRTRSKNALVKVEYDEYSVKSTQESSLLNESLDEICNIATNLMLRFPPSMLIVNQKQRIPNYEGRSMSFIIFALKLFFGLDDLTEFHLSTYAKHLNTECENARNFDFEKWLEYIGYRNLVISKNHFPTSYSMGGEDVDSDLFLQHIESRDIKPCIHKSTKEMNDYKDVLTKLKEAQSDFNKHIEFPPNFTPFFDYCQHISRNVKERYLANFLDLSFHDDSVQFLLNPKKYLEALNEKVEVFHGGANNNWVIENIHSFSRTDTSLVPVEVIGSDQDESVNFHDKINIVSDARYFQRKHNKLFNEVFKENEELIKPTKTYGQDSVKNHKVTNYSAHFLPHERYWFHLHMNVDALKSPTFKNFFKKFPKTFKTVLQECSRVTEQEEQEILEEFQFTELYLVYCNEPNRNTFQSKQLKCMINQARMLW